MKILEDVYAGTPYGSDKHQSRFVRCHDREWLDVKRTWECRDVSN